MAKKDIPPGAEAVEVVWAYRPDDRSKQGKREWLARDVAEMKVREGLARWVGTRFSDEPMPEPASEKVDPGTIVTDAATGKSTKAAGTRSNE